MKCPVCGRDSGLNPFSICQFYGNALDVDLPPEAPVPGGSADGRPRANN